MSVKEQLLELLIFRWVDIEIHNPHCWVLYPIILTFGSCDWNLVDLTGVEPATSAMRMQRSPN